MKALGIIRRLDDIGRIVIPKEIRTRLGVADGDNAAFEMFTQNRDEVVIKIYQPDCIFCGDDATDELHGKHICNGCIGIIKAWKGR